MKKLIRRLLFKNLWVFRKITDPLIPLAYFVRASHWFHVQKSQFIDGPRNAVFEEVVQSESLANKEFIYLEFGVSRGWSFGYWLERCSNPNATFWGFDTFSGLPEAWGSVAAGTYSTDGKVPAFDDQRARFCVGLFDQTLIPFIRENQLDKQLIVHLDADLYSSTLYVLVKLQPYLKANDILIFDEFFSVTKSHHELRAFDDFLSIFPLKFIPLIKTPNQLAIKLLGPLHGPKPLRTSHPAPGF